MRTTYWVPGARRRGFSLLAGLALLCLAGTIVLDTPARAEAPAAESGPFTTGEADALPTRVAEAPTGGNGLLTTGDGYAHPQGSTRVRALQRRLRTLGLRPGPVDGFFGAATKAAVERFQHALGLQVDGIVGPRRPHRGTRNRAGPAARSGCRSCSGTCAGSACGRVPSTDCTVRRRQRPWRAFSVAGASSRMEWPGQVRGGQSRWRRTRPRTAPLARSGQPHRASTNRRHRQHLIGRGRRSQPARRRVNPAPRRPGQKTTVTSAGSCWAVWLCSCSSRWLRRSRSGSS